MHTTNISRTCPIQTHAQGKTSFIIIQHPQISNHFISPKQHVPPTLEVPPESWH